ncbi:MAG TPA: hypothetical protein VG346_03810 [Acidimicrobiales bacterium]|jgi:hypothetical protein|nr:hypothetical protein [Acidimicrobiales bacterium]
MRRVSAWVDARTAPVAVTVALAAGALLFSLLWSVAANHHHWHQYSDLWNSAGLAFLIGHGHFAAVYAPPSQLDAPPGLEFLLAPLMVVGHDIFGLAVWQGEGSSETFSLVLAVVGTLVASTALFALDAVARTWEFSDTRRLALSAVAGLGVVSAAAWWGHPEDCLALALVVWATLAVDGKVDDKSDGATRWRRAAWLLGLAVAFQPLALLAVAPVLVRFSWRELRGAAWRLALPTAVVMLPVLAAAPARTLHAVLDQPYNPAGESSTPLAHFARSLGHDMYSGGLLRLVATAAAVALGLVVCRRRHDLATVLLVMTLAFTLRVALETELLGFYFFPVVALALVLTLRRSWALFWACAATSVVNLVLGNHKVHHITSWWPALMTTTLVMVALATSAWRQDARAAGAPNTPASAGWRPAPPQTQVRLVDQSDLDQSDLDQSDRSDRSDRDQNAGVTFA